MANPILSKLQTSPGNSTECHTGANSNQDGFLIESLKLIRKVITGRRSIAGDDIPDVIQDAALRLLKWRTKYVEKSSQMTESEWNSFTARTAHNEVNRRLANRSSGIAISIDDTSEEIVWDKDTSADAIQLTQSVWQGICLLSLYQRQALLFSSIDLVVYLLQLGVEEDSLIEMLGITKGAWEEIALKMPLSDIEIAEIAGSNRLRRKIKKNRASSVKKARFDARRKLKELIKQ